jgi:ribosomal RNA-processing protein 9
MSDPFLALPGTKRKRPSRPTRPNNQSSTSHGQSRSQQKPPAYQKKRRLRDKAADDHENEDEDDEVGAGAIDSDGTIQGDEVPESEESDIDESAADKRLRLAKAYLDQVRSEVGTPSPLPPKFSPVSIVQGN